MFEGTVVSNADGKVIPYASVGFLKENAGVNADENGHFFLEASSKQFDTLIFSSVGFESLRISANQFSNQSKVTLRPKIQLLSEVLIRNREKIQTTLNESSNCGTHYLTTMGHTVQVAQLFYAPVDKSVLTEVNICKYGMAVIDPDKCIFRLRVYAVDSLTGKPGRELTATSIEVTGSGRHVVVDMEPYNIRVPAKFFVAVEWLKIKTNQWKAKTKFNGNVISYFSYSPSLAMKERDKKDRTSFLGSEVFLLDYTGRWHAGSPGSKMMFTAKVEY